MWIGTKIGQKMNLTGIHLFQVVLALLLASAIANTAGTHYIPMVIVPHAMWGPPVSLKHLSIVLIGMLALPVSIMSTLCSMRPPLTQSLTKSNKYKATLMKTLGFPILSG